MARQRRRRAFGIALGVVLVGVGASFIWHTQKTIERLTPPNSVVDLQTFMQQMPKPDSGYELNVGGSQHIELVGPLPSKWTLPAGPPSYIFDASGQLVDWTWDIGEDPDFVSAWHGSGRRVLTEEEVAAWVSSSADDG